MVSLKATNPKQTLKYLQFTVVIDHEHMINDYRKLQIFRVIFRAINFRFVSFSYKRPLTEHINVNNARMRFNFVRLIFVHSIEYENISTTKISQFTVVESTDLRQQSLDQRIVFPSILWLVTQSKLVKG